MSSSPGEKSAIDRLFEVGVFAPLGFLLTRDQAIADLAAAGRKQIAFSRSLGRVAINGLIRGAQGSRSESQGATATSPEPTSLPESDVSGAVADYDSLTARQVIALVADCDEPTVDWVRARETAGKNRVTVMRAVDARPIS